MNDERRIFWGRNGFDSGQTIGNARRGRLVGHAKLSRQSEATTLNCNSSRPNCRGPVSGRFPVCRKDRRIGKNAVSRRVIRGWWKCDPTSHPQACKSVPVISNEHAGSIPAASTTLRELPRGACRNCDRPPFTLSRLWRGSLQGRPSRFPRKIPVAGLPS